MSHTIAVPIKPYSGTVELTYLEFYAFIQRTFNQLNVPTHLTVKYLRSKGWNVSDAENEMPRLATLMRSYGFTVSYAKARMPSDEQILNFFNSKC